MMLLVESYNTDKYLFNTYGEVFTLNRSRDDSDKDQDPFAGSEQGTKRRKSSKEAESSKDSRSKEKKSSRTSKDASQSQHKYSSKYAYAEEPSHTVDDTGVQQDQEFNTGNNEYNPLTRRRYSTSVTKTKAATYEIKWIKDLVHNLWSPVKDVYSTKRIIGVTRITIMNKYDYGHLEEIEVCQEDQKLYKFREGDFLQLRLQDIEDILLLLVQQKLTNLPIKLTFQKMLNLTKPDTFKSNLRNRTTYTAYSDPKGVIYKDQMNKNRLMRADELHKFSDGTLDDVRFALNDIAKGIRMEYLSKRKWSGLDKRQPRVMIQDIDKQLYERRLLWNLEKFVGGTEYGNDLRLLERTI
ncbi:hypothetical protein Tco_0516608 [Tanacetum coccineum]